MSTLADEKISLQEIQDRFAIADLYDRQLAAIEAFDFVAYDTTFANDAKLDLSDFGLQPCEYPEYRAWLVEMKPVMVNAQRIIGGLRLELEGDRAVTRVPVSCHVIMSSQGKQKLTHTGVFYNDLLERGSAGWRISSRREELSWADGM